MIHFPNSDGSFTGAACIVILSSNALSLLYTCSTNKAAALCIFVFRIS